MPGIYHSNLLNNNLSNIDDIKPLFRSHEDIKFNFIQNDKSEKILHFVI